MYILARHKKEVIEMILSVTIVSIAFLVCFTLLSVLKHDQAASKLLELIPLLFTGIPAMVAAIKLKKVENRPNLEDLSKDAQPKKTLASRLKKIKPGRKV